MTKVFKVQESAVVGEYMIIFDVFAVDVPPISSSYNVVAARLLGFTFPDYLRYCKSRGAELRGKQGYTYAIWKNKTMAESLVKELNKIWGEVE
jgi:hypothetical protein